MIEKEFLNTPSKSEKAVLRVMIVLGTVSIFILLFELLQKEYIGEPVLYTLLMTGIFYYCLRILADWYHYFSISIPGPPVKYHDRSVDIFTTFYPGEPYDMVLNTLTEIQKIRYPHKTYLCDEADDTYLKNECDKLGIIHISRADRKDAKAGNINNALKYASGELCVILDPDHIPSPEMLDQVVPYFEDDEIGYVQIVQAYRNTHESLIAKGAGQQTYLYYGPLMMGMNSYGTVQSLGANCTFRRKALDSIGGHAAGLAEDMHTAMKLHAGGWKSLYLPKVLTRGLVPSTLSAYYKQQLKWSKGTFDLFFTTFFNLFLKFSWRQKLHYAFTPLYYLSGLVFLFNFIVPSLSLITGIIPLKMDLEELVLIVIPVMLSNFLISQYVQRWVMEETERGLHLVGGLLQLGTWWIYLLGLYYAVIRKKIPYIPTPKDDKEDKSWVLIIPNSIIAIISIFAIIYGLHYDLNPFSLVMAGLAFLNVIFMVFNIYAGKQNTFQKLGQKNRLIRLFGSWLNNIKIIAWKLRHFLYSISRSSALFFLITGITICFYILTKSNDYIKTTRKSTFGSISRYYGICLSGKQNNEISFEKIYHLQKSIKFHFDIIARNITWGSQDSSFLPVNELQEIYENHSIPLISWIADENNNNPANKKFSQHTEILFDQILNGLFDNYLDEFFSRARSLNKPLFVQFAFHHYDWSGSSSNPDEDIPGKYADAWKYIVSRARNHRAYNIIWVWNIQNPESLSDFFPGREYVDWIGISALDFNRSYNQEGNADFRGIYRRLRDYPLLKSDIPVILTEFGGLQSLKNNSNRMLEVLGEIKKYYEIKAIVLMDSFMLKLNSPPDTEKSMHRQYPDTPGFLSSIQDQKSPEICEELIETKQEKGGKDNPASDFKEIKGINYLVGLHWRKSRYAITRQDIENDFNQIKSIGINAIKRSGPGIYDHDILKVAENKQLSIFYSFKIEPDMNFRSDYKKLNKLKSDILKTVRKFNNKKIIKAWVIDGTDWTSTSGKYVKPELYCQHNLLTSWLLEITENIRQIDNARILTVELAVNPNTIALLDQISVTIYNIDAIGIQSDSKKIAEDLTLTKPFYFSDLDPENDSFPVNRGKFMARWRDNQTIKKVSFNGLLDYSGRPKLSYFKIRNDNASASKTIKVNPIHILRPAKIANPGKKFDYYVLEFFDNKWQLADTVNSTYEWYLIEKDLQGTDRSMKPVGIGRSVSIDMPENPEYYKLYVISINNGVSFSTVCPLLYPTAYE